MHFTSTDFDECAAGMHNCRQICNNTVNGFTCSCYSGYQLSTDEASCNGTVIPFKAATSDKRT